MHPSTAEVLGERLDDLLGRRGDQVHLVARGAVGLDQVERLGVDDRLDGVLERLVDDLADLVAVPALGEGQHRLADPGELLLARSEVEVDDLRDDERAG